MTKNALSTPPFTDVNDQGITGVFDDASVGKIVSIIDEGFRAAGSAVISVPDIYSGDQLECFVSFVALDLALTDSVRNTISDSDYAGSVTVA